MHSARLSLVPIGSASCDSEPVPVPAAIQPHGLLLLFDVHRDSLAHWAGDFARLLGVEPAVGRRAVEMLGAPLHDLIAAGLPVAGAEAVLVGAISPAGRERLTMVVSRADGFIAVELEIASDLHTAAAALERVRAISDGIGSRPTLVDACDSAIAQVRAITGFDRIMVHKFLADGSGSVIAEARAPGVQAFLDHRFAASDQPDPARDLYRRNLVRITPDVGYTAAALEPAGSAPAIDMSLCILRSIAPTHVEYLKSMGVCAAMSISLITDGKLWGLITGHHYHARQVPAESRLLCRHVGVALSAFIHSFEQAESAQRNAASSAALEDALHNIRCSTDPERTLRASAEQLAKLVDCGGFALLAHRTVIATAGRVPNSARLRSLATLLETEFAGRESFATDRLGEVIAGASAVAAEASGALAVWIEGSRPLLALWLRPQQVEEICWAGDPREDQSAGDLHATTARQSFATWRETIQGRSRPWTRQEIKLVELLRGRAEGSMQRHRLKQLNGELGAANATLNSLATTDPLTGLPNRRLFDGRLATEWQRAQREHGSLAVVAIDVDNFKKYNDSFGHPAGDECLKQVAAAIAAGRRGVDVAARLGGEEFALLLIDIDASEAAALADRVRTAVERLALVHPLNEAGVVTISVGVATGTPAQWGDYARLVGAADQALYGAKARGRNCVHAATA